MTQSELQRTGEFLATHALVVLGLALLLGLFALALIIGSVRALRRYRGTVRNGFTAVLHEVRQSRVVERSRITSQQV